jgi:voltage-gated potassium channel
MIQLLKIGRVSLVLVLVLVLGTLGYHVLLGWEWLDSLYMTTITITTVGYGEVRQLGTEGRILTIILTLSSVGLFAYGLTTLASLVVEVKLGTLMWRRRMENRINKVSNHYLICGYGRTGRSVCDKLEASRVPFVVLETNPEKIDLLLKADRLFVDGDATHDESLRRAGIDRAKGIVAALGNDAENVYLVLSARQMRPTLTIVSWATSEEAERKVLRAGANHAISPYAQGGRRIAHLLTTPHALEFLDHVMGASENIRLGEIEVGPGSPIIGHSLKNAGIRRDVGVIVIGIRRADGRLEFNPSADEVLNEHDILIGIGNPEQIERLRKML